MYKFYDVSLDWIANGFTPNWALLLLGLSPIIYWYSTRNHTYWCKRRIKSPPTVPFLGNFFSVFTPLPLLYKKYCDFYGKVLGLYHGETPVLLISDPELIRRILVKDFLIFRNRVDVPRNRIFAKNLIAARSEEWKRIRSILTPIFTSSKLKKMECTIQGCVRSLIDHFDSLVKNRNTEFEVCDPMGNYSMDVIAKCAFATDTNAHRDRDNVFVRSAMNFLCFNFVRYLSTILLPVSLSRRLLQANVPPFYRKEIDFFETLSRHLIKQRKDTKKAQLYNDMLQLMINAEHNKDSLISAFHEEQINSNSNNEELDKEQRELKDIIGSKYLSEEEIVAQAMVFLLAGYETTASTLSHCLYELAVNPKIQDRLYKEIQTAKLTGPVLAYSALANLNYLDAVISETLRKYPPAWLLIREAAEQYHIPEYNLTLEKGQAVNIPIYAIHHSEEYYPNPEKFDPERFMHENRNKIVPYTYLPFGGGPRNCIGMRFAMTEAKIALANILDRFKIVTTDKTNDRLTILHGFFLLRTSPIYVALEKR